MSSEEANKWFGELLPAIADLVLRFPSMLLAVSKPAFACSLKRLAWFYLARIIAMDALSRVGKRQYGHNLLLREVNKAFCGFSDPCKSHRYEILLKGDHLSEPEHDQKLKSLESNTDNVLPAIFEAEAGIVTGNWGCGVFGGDPELKTILQWLAASQVTKSITSNGLSVSDLWKYDSGYSSQRSKKKTKVGFFDWLLPRLSSDNPIISDP